MQASQGKTIRSRRRQGARIILFIGCLLLPAAMNGNHESGLAMISIRREGPA
jgi:hypothetical protein